MIVCARPSNHGGAAVYLAKPTAPWGPGEDLCITCGQRSNRPLATDLFLGRTVITRSDESPPLLAHHTD